MAAPQCTPRYSREEAPCPISPHHLPPRARGALLPQGPNTTAEAGDLIRWPTRRPMSAGRRESSARNPAEMAAARGRRRRRRMNRPPIPRGNDDDDTVEELLQMLETSTCQVTMATQELVRRCDGASDALAQARQRLKAQAASHESALAALRSQLAEARSALAAERQAADDLRAAIKDADAAVAQAVEGVRAALAEMGVAALAPAPPADGEPAPSKVSWVLGAARETVRAAKGYGWWSVRVAMRRAVAALRRQGCTHLHQAAFLEECADEEESEVVDTVVEGFLTKAWNRYGADAKLRAIADAVQQRRNRNLPPSPSPSPGVAVQ